MADLRSLSCDLFFGSGQNDVPMECIPEALQTVNKVALEMEVSLWPRKMYVSLLVL